ncbi:endoplasmic reticulum multispan transmembrane protein-related [Anaeramoeba flamelloides]|uniref:Protein RFT1 homolog n=1 Tax=Anaeramoeba flamelloides TaxID=1746091 RepID=A0AAV7ZG36_9EUKA|nr:endoplasmic reticulum multispan transmembrane protein-related [Anaeramoeba flamelloides]
MIRRGIASISALVGLQTFARITSTILAIVTLRRLSAEMYGIVNFRMPLLLSSILFLSRESFHRATVRSHKEDDKKGLYLVWYSAFPIGFLFTIGMTFFTIYKSPKGVPYYSLAMILVAFGSWIELVCEPVIVWLASNLLFNVQAVIEGIAILIKSLFIVGAVYLPKRNDLLFFGLSQIVYSIILFCGYYGYFLKKKYPKSEIFPSFSDFFSFKLIKENLERCKMIIRLFLQSILTHFLTEGEKFVLIKMKSLYDEGVYGIVSNQGSIVLRIIFLPIETVGYSLFARFHLAGENESLKLITITIIKLMTYIGSIFSIFGFNYSYTAVKLVYGSKWTVEDDSVPKLLGIYCLFILFCALNGVTEAFLRSIADKKVLDKLNTKLIIFSSVYWGLLWYFIKQFGISGLIFANCFNMLMRIVNSMIFIKNYFGKNFSIFLLLPNWRVIIFAYIPVVIAITASSKMFERSLNPKQVLLHIIIGITTLIILLSMIYIFDNQFLKNAKEIWKERKKKKQEKRKKED